jgi:hypothetical protein
MGFNSAFKGLTVITTILLNYKQATKAEHKNKSIVVTPSLSRRTIKMLSYDAP